MNILIILAQLIIAISILSVWTLRYQNVDRDFNNFKLSNKVKNIVGATKISLSTALILGIWYPDLIFFSTLSLALFMIAAQYFHFKVANPIVKKAPSFILLILCLFVVVAIKFM